MLDFIDTFWDKLRFLVVAAIMIGSLLLLPFLLSLIYTAPTVRAASTNSTSSNMEGSLEDSPNIITSGVFDASDNLGNATRSTERAISNTSKSITTATMQTGKFMAHSVSTATMFAVHGVGSGIGFIAHGVTNSFGFMANTTGSILGFIGHTPSVSAIIRPSDKTTVPIIESKVTATSAVPQTAAPASPLPSSKPAVDSQASWPIHGIITTNFGVPHWPYQPTHTGLDISDGQRSGVTPIHPFKPGRVIQTISSSSGLGNHVLVDHGNGLVSVYGHMYSISVGVGQEVNKGTILGYEGSTGASTGTHLHFEIRLNGTPVDPRKYVSGQP
jgi:murein DD-endopeptidase MepM/ murein hydrolase activator NlpD